MKIKKVKWNNHEILGNLEIDFTNAEYNRPFDNIFLVGENCAGKTSILQTLSTFLYMGSFEPFQYIEYDVEGDVYTCLPRGA